MSLGINAANSRLVPVARGATALILDEMADTVKLDSANAIPRTWRILMYAVSILGFGNVAMCSWLPAKLRTISIIYHGVSLLIHIINAIIFVVGFQFTGEMSIMIPKLNLLFAVICGTTLCGLNFCATFTQRPYACLHNWSKCSFGSEKSSLQAIFMFLIPVLMTAIAITSCYYNGNMMYEYASVMMNQLSTPLVKWPNIQHVVFWKFVIINELLILASTLYSALACSIVFEIYICVSALYEELLNICKRRQVSQCELQIWRRKCRCLENVVRAMNGYLGGSVLVLLTLSVSSLILMAYYFVGKGMIEPGLVLPVCNVAVFMACLTIPSAVLSGKVSKLVLRYTELILGLRPDNERRRYFVTTYLIGWGQA